MHILLELYVSIRQKAGSLGEVPGRGGGHWRGGASLP